MATTKGPQVSLSQAQTIAPATLGPGTGNQDPDATLPPSAPGGSLPVEEPRCIGGYKLLRRLGSGGMGTVYEAEDPGSGQRVALKLISGTYAHNPEVVQRFRQEGKLASKLTHPRCVFILAADEDQGRPYIVMELMPGQSLGDFVREKGPLPVQEAMLKILDVIEGLQEVHKLGLVHRDVKPSNCFLEANGRVKVADFGLAKSLARDSLGDSSAHLTKTGTFLGTPLYAAPEQVKGDKIDQQADVYAVAATLYFLLTGKAPFEGAGDPMAVLAQIVSEDPKPASDLCPGLPPELDAVLLRALERDKRRRFRTLNELHDALLPFTPRRQDIVGLGFRIGAYILDYLFFSALLTFLIKMWDLLAISHPLGGIRFVRGDIRWLQEGVTLLVFLTYFALQEKWYGCTLGKRLLRLRVCQEKHAALPRYSQALVRSLVCFFFLFTLVELVAWFDSPTLPSPSVSRAEREWWIFMEFLKAVGLRLSCWSLLFVPMRRRNGYRGLHEWLSGTRTVRVPGPQATKRPTVIHRRDNLPVHQYEDAPHEIGPYVVHGCHRWETGQQILLGEESSLGRIVWIWRRLMGSPALSPKRREISREGRWRWLATGGEDGWLWDAFLATPGASLPIVLQRTGPMSWQQARPLLLALSQELLEACADGTLPEELHPTQVWLQANGGIQLLDMTPETTPTQTVSPGPDDETRAIALLRQVVLLMLEGNVMHPPEITHVRVPLPGHARSLLDRLLGSRTISLADWHRELQGTLDKPAEVNRTWRIWYSAVHGGTLLLGVVLYENLFKGLTVDTNWPWERDSIFFALPVFYLTCGLWSFCSRGGLLLRWMGLTLCQVEGLPASRWRCAWRTLLTGLPIVAIVLAQELFGRTLRESPWIYGNLVYVGLGIALVVYFLILLLGVLLQPRRGFHDNLAGTYVVPR